jgi:hypothetical protein
VLLAATAVSGAAQDVAGDWQGTRKGPGVELRVVLHFGRDAAGLTVTPHSPFSVPAVNGSYTAR